MREEDLLGVVVVSVGISPFCVLMAGAGDGEEIKVGEVPGAERNLFASGVGQVSLRGKGGTVTPVGYLEGEVRWFAVVE